MCGVLAGSARFTAPPDPGLPRRRRGRRLRPACRGRARRRARIPPHHSRIRRQLSAGLGVPRSRRRTPCATAPCTPACTRPICTPTRPRTPEAVARGFVGRTPRTSKARRVTENAYLVGLRLAGKKVVVVGGGTVAQRRLPLLIASGADVHVIARAATPAVEAMAGNPAGTGITLTLRDIATATSTAPGMRSPPPTTRTSTPRSSPRPTARRIFCVRADIAPGGLRRHAGVVRLRRAAVGVLAGGEHRRSAAIRSAIREALQQGIIGDGGARGDLTAASRWSAAGPAIPELITVRGRRLLAHADVVVADRLAPPELLAELPPARRGDRRRQDPVRPGDGAGGDQRRADRAGQGRQVRGAPQGRRPVRVRPRL